MDRKRYQTPGVPEGQTFAACVVTTALIVGAMIIGASQWL
jgi:hypothetical protein